MFFNNRASLVEWLVMELSYDMRAGVTLLRGIWLHNLDTSTLPASHLDRHSFTGKAARRWVRPRLQGQERHLDEGGRDWSRGGEIACG